MSCTECRVVYNETGNSCGRSHKTSEVYNYLQGAQVLHLLKCGEDLLIHATLV
jgi:hypothetical protein